MTFPSFRRLLSRSRWSAGVFAALLAGLAGHPRPALAHGFAGQRFFPATLTTDDPFVADELSLPTVALTHSSDRGGTRELDVTFDLAKRITPFLGVEVAATEINLFPHEGSNKTGFTNLVLGAKFQFYTNPTHEFILSAGTNVTVGGTGSRQVGRDPFSTWAPGLFFGKGFGDLPTGLPWLRPFALTGNVSLDVPTSARTRSFGGVDPTTGLRAVQVNSNPLRLETHFALEYSLIYLQGHVKDFGLRAPFDRLIPLVEFVVDTPLDRGRNGLTTVSVNPGVIWSGRFWQFGVEALIPANHRTGHTVGVLGQMHFYLDDLFPRSLGRPLFGGGRSVPTGPLTGAPK